MAAVVGEMVAADALSAADVVGSKVDAVGGETVSNLRAEAVSGLLAASADARAVSNIAASNLSVSHRLLPRRLRAGSRITFSSWKAR